MSNTVFFNDIPIGRSFKTISKITYQKISNKESIPILTATKKQIENKKRTVAFYNSKIPLTIVS